jgi:protein TonB
MEKLEDTKIGTANQEGTKDEGIVAPVEDKGGVVEAPKQDDEDKVFQKVEIDAEFPGGSGGWTKYVTREIERNIDELQDEGKSGTCVVLFIVDKEGGVSEVKALSCGEAGVANCLGPGTKLAEIAVNAIRKGPKWKPAVQNGRNVKAYRRQPVTFQLAEE